MATYVPLLLPVVFFIVVTLGVLVGNAGIKSLQESESHPQQLPPSE